MDDRPIVRGGSRMDKIDMDAFRLSSGREYSDYQELISIKRKEDGSFEIG
jgi:hypothetical protein